MQACSLCKWLCFLCCVLERGRVYVLLFKSIISCEQDMGYVGCVYIRVSIWRCFSLAWLLIETGRDIA